MRTIDAEALRIAIDAIKQTGYDTDNKPLFEYVELPDLIKAIDDAPTVELTFKPIAEVKFDKEQLQEIVDKAKAEVLASVERLQGQWIPVSEGLPNCNGVYNVTRIIDGTAISGACYFDGQNTWHEDICVNHGRPYLTDIVAWQPLPEPYKKGGAE